MDKYYRLEIAGLTRRLPICKIADDLSIAAFVLFGDVEMTVFAAKALLDIAPDFDVIITAEAKGIPLAYEMARQNGNSPYIVARKITKLYMRDIFSVEYQSITTAKRQNLYIDAEESKSMAGKRVLIVDDVISTGQSLMAVEKMVLESGGIIAGKYTILAEGAAKDRKDITYLAALPLLDGDGEVIL